MSFSFRLTFFWALVSLAPPLGATQFAPLSIEEITRQADVIVQGTVVCKTCARNERGNIFTRIELAVSETWKGPATTNLTIVQSGGILGEEGEMVPGQAEYEIGEEVVAFLVLNPRGEALTLGLAHGKFHVWKDSQTGEKLARNIFHGASAHQAGAKVNASGISLLKLTDLKRRALQTK